VATYATAETMIDRVCTGGPVAALEAPHSGSRDTMTNLPKDDVRAEFAAWCATPKRLKKQFNLPLTKTDFAYMKGVSDRTLRRWELQESFQTLVQQRKVEFAGNVPNGAIAAIGPARPVKHGTALKRLTPPEPVKAEDDSVFDEGLSTDELRYQQVKDTLVRMAMDGNQSAIDMYMKHYGKPFIEAEQQSANMFPEMSDEQLLAEVQRYAGRLAA